MTEREESEPMDYDAYAPRYATAREAVPWVIAPLADAVRRLPVDASVVDIGCGTGNYVIALEAALPGRSYHGFDLSEPMLAVARGRSGRVIWAHGDANERFPYADGACEAAFAIDVIHHITALDVFFREAARILSPRAILIVVTDSEDDIRSRSLTRFFPEILDVELRRYPRIATLHALAENAGLQRHRAVPATGTRVLDAHFLAQLDAKCSSAMRLIPPEAHQRGMDRVREACSRGERWHSCYTVITYIKHAP
jgi:SAM-dependent methyltransferase